MDYFAGLDISMDETQVCVLDREGLVVRESKLASTAEAIAGELAKAPSCRRIVFETWRRSSGEVDYVNGISKCGDQRVRTLLYEAERLERGRYPVTKA